ncbi:twin-arginine translocase subunit TatC [Mycetohabitans sp. B46]|uniref:twin-arginine translocase subunit TatC n=1 Tax=Mycetohabitans sp. B46 TaxID=2772536 RepID=UPI00307D92FF
MCSRARLAWRGIRRQTCGGRSVSCDPVPFPVHFFSLSQAAVSEAPQNPQNEGTEETFISHLIELRTRVIRAAVSVLVVFVSLVYWAPDIFRLLAHPLMMNLPKGGKMIVTDVTGSFFVPMKVTMLVAFVIALPVVLYQIWAFVAPGLYQHEKKLVVPLVSSSYVLFLCGMAFAYFVVFPTIFRVMAHYNAPLGAEMSTDIDNYLSFVLTMFIAFGVTFEVPIVVVLLAKLNMVTVNKLKEVRPYVIVGAFVVSAIVTPPDVFSQLILAVPLLVLYELGIIAARLLVTQQPDSEPQSEEAK